MIPATNLYKNSKVKPPHSRAEVEILLEKFGVKKFGWKRDVPENSFLMFQKTEDFSGKDQEITYKVSIPFIEKPQGKYKEAVYDETRSYRIMFHVLKHLLLNTDVGMSFEQAFGNYIVVGQLPNKDPQNVQESIGEAVMGGKLPALPMLS